MFLKASLSSPVFFSDLASTSDTAQPSWFYALSFDDLRLSLLTFCLKISLLSPLFSLSARLKLSCIS